MFEYKKPEIEVVVFNNEDIITESNENETEVMPEE